jgi:hypothetical protein
MTILRRQNRAGRAHIFRQFLVYPGYLGQSLEGIPGRRIFLFLYEFVNTPGKVANPLDALG